MSEWETAIQVAYRHAARTGVKQHVYWNGVGWVVSIYPKPRPHDYGLPNYPLPGHGHTVGSTTATHADFSHTTYDHHGWGHTYRDPDCVAAWPECEAGKYDPRCCRFPKSCSA